MVLSSTNVLGHVHDYTQMPVACGPGLDILVSDLIFQASYMATGPVGLTRWQSTQVWAECQRRGPLQKLTFNLLLVEI